MKLLLDQNLSHKLVAALATEFPGIAHVREFGLARADDAVVWAFAKDREYTIVSKDDDFHQRSFLYGHPPRVVWLRLGNCATARVGECLRGHREVIVAFHADAEKSFLALA